MTKKFAEHNGLDLVKTNQDVLAEHALPGAAGGPAERAADHRRRFDLRRRRRNPLSADQSAVERSGTDRKSRSPRAAAGGIAFDVPDGSGACLHADPGLRRTADRADPGGRRSLAGGLGVTGLCRV